MKLKLITHMEEEFTLGVWSDEDQEWYPFEDEEPERIAELLGCSVEMVSFFKMTFADLVDAIRRDMVELYERSET